MSRRFGVVINECAAVAHPNPRPVNWRRTPNAAPNFNFAPEALLTGLPREVTELEMDWLELLVAMYAADLACGRGAGDLDWGRDIQLHIALRNPAAWASHTVALQEIFSDLTSDRLRLYLYQDPDPLPSPRYGAAWPAFDAVALFSGGSDSLVGAGLLLDDGRAPLLISHGSGAVTTPQLKAREHLASCFSARPDARISANMLENFQDREDSQRARSLLFMGAAALVGEVAGVEDIYINENGVMAVHIPLTGARIGSLSTKTAYPPIVEKISAVASRALGTPLRIHNRLVAQTKPEVLATGRQIGLGHALADTASCWTWSRHRRHCGVCVPCLTRRISFELEGITDRAHHADPLDDAHAIDKPFARDNLAHLCQVVEGIEGLDDLAFELEHPEILDGGSMITPGAARDLYRRWAEQALRVLRSHSVPQRFLVRP